jgi:predicted nucleic acid-binding protein
VTGSRPLAVDASVAVKWFAEEIYTPEALLLSNSLVPLVGPELILAEVASSLLKKVRRGEFRREMVHRSLDLLADRLVTFSTLGMERRCFDLADRHGCSLYDGLYMLIALEIGGRLVTADQRLHNALNVAYAESLLWIGDVPADLG